MTDSDSKNHKDAIHSSPDAAGEPFVLNNANSEIQNDKKEHRHSPGEKIFDAITYQGIGILGTAALSIYLADLFKNGAGKPVFNKIAETIGPPLSKMRGIKDPKQTIEAAHSALIFGALFSGGTILMAPVKKLEDDKEHIVKWLDDKYNSVFTPSEQTLEIQETTHKRLVKEVSPSWGNLLLARGLITATIGAVVYALAGRDTAITDKLADDVSKSMTKSDNATFRKWGKSDRFKNLFSISLIDLYQSTIGGVVLYMTTHKYKQMHKAKQELAENDNLIAQPRIEQPTERQQGVEAEPLLKEITAIDKSVSQLDKEPKDNITKNDDWSQRFSRPNNHADKVVEMLSTQDNLGLGA